MAEEDIEAGGVKITTGEPAAVDRGRVAPGGAAAATSSRRA
ncbi:hypothetical protein [Saccharothrix syringae]|nr:hypothetical protein [Saccharothrix syringae]